MKVYTIIIMFIIKCDFIFAQDLNGKSFLDYQISSERYLADEKGNILMHVNVWGHIGNPGHHLVYDGIDLATLFSIVGGPRKGANLKNVKIIREVPDDNGQISYNGTYRVLLNNITALELIPNNKNPLPELAIRAVTSNEASVDVNGDGEIWVSSEQNEETPDLYGKFNLSVEACAKSTCNPDDGGRVFFVADGSPLINAIYDYEGFADGDYGKTDTIIPANDNRKWALDIIAEAMMTSLEDEGLEPSENAMVIFDESRHPQNAVLADSYNTIYFLLVYFTGEGLAMLVLFLILFISFEAVLIRKKDPDNWRHVFSIIYYGFGDANRYPYYSKVEKIRQVFLSKVRNQNGLTREEFHAMSARELVALINDPTLAKFAIEPGKYSLEQTVSIVKRVKAWGRR